jgi:hypothetical protein
LSSVAFDGCEQRVPSHSGWWPAALVVGLSAFEPQEMEAADVEESLLSVPGVHFHLCLGGGDPFIAPRTLLTSTRSAECFQRRAPRKLPGRKLGADSRQQLGVR